MVKDLPTDCREIDSAGASWIDLRGLGAGLFLLEAEPLQSSSPCLSFEDDEGAVTLRC